MNFVSFRLASVARRFFNLLVILELYSFRSKASNEALFLVIISLLICEEPVRVLGLIFIDRLRLHRFFRQNLNIHFVLRLLRRNHQVVVLKVDISQFIVLGAFQSHSLLSIGFCVVV